MAMNALTQDEIQAVFDYYDMRVEEEPEKRKEHLRYKLIFAIGIFAGLRISEILSLTTCDVRGEYVCLRKCNTKGKLKGRKIPMNEFLQSVRDDYLFETELDVFGTEYLFPNKTNPEKHITPRLFDYKMKECYEYIGIDPGNLGSHTMRKTFAKYVLGALGNDIFSLSKLLGHCNISNTVYYLKSDPEVCKIAINKLPVPKT